MWNGVWGLWGGVFLSLLGKFISCMSLANNNDNNNNILNEKIVALATG